MGWTNLASLYHSIIQLSTSGWFYSAFTESGASRQWQPIRWLNWNNRFQHFQIQPVKCLVQTMKSQLVRWDARDYGVWNLALEIIVLLHFRFYIYNHDKLMTIFHREQTATQTIIFINFALVALKKDSTQRRATLPTRMLTCSSKTVTTCNHMS